MGGRIETPWGLSDDGGHELAEGIVFYTTPSHGGFRLSAERVAAMPEALARIGTESVYHGRPSDGGAWFEEDCESAAVVAAFSELFSGSEILEADAMLRGCYGLARSTTLGGSDDRAWWEIAGGRESARRAGHRRHF